MAIGFIGTGAIAEAMIVGLAESGNFDDLILVSRRSEARSSALGQRFTQVEVVAENQQIVDRANVVFLATLPQQALVVFKSLKFQSDQLVVSLAAGISVEAIAAVVRPASQIHRIIPMPPNEYGVGPIPVYPPCSDLHDLLGKIGTVIPVNDQSNFSAFSGSSALMATFFELLAMNAMWIEAQGVDPEVAATYSTSLFESLAVMAGRLSPNELQEISQECLTIGGLNEQVLNANLEADWFGFLQAELDKVMKRIANSE